MRASRLATAFKKVAKGSWCWERHGVVDQGRDGVLISRGFAKQITHVLPRPGLGYGATPTRRVAIIAGPPLRSFTLSPTLISIPCTCAMRTGFGIPDVGKDLKSPCWEALACSHFLVAVSLRFSVPAAHEPGDDPGARLGYQGRQSRSNHVEQSTDILDSRNTGVSATWIT